MNPSIVISFVSVLAAAQPAPSGVKVRSLIQGSGSVVCFDRAKQMSKPSFLLAMKEGAK